MKKFDMYLYDHLDREYDRKNLYLYEVASLQYEIEGAQGNEKAELKKKLDELIKGKAEHPYIKKLSEYKSREKSFLEETNKKIAEYRGKVDKNLPKRVQNLEVRLFKAKQLVSFYEKYVELTYDAEILFEQNKMEIAQIPTILNFAKETYKELVEAQANKNNINSEKNSKFQEEFKNFKIEEKKNLQEKIKDIKVKQKEGLISKQARENTIKEVKRKYREAVMVKSFECEKTYNEEVIKNKKYELNKTLKQKINTVNVNVSDLRRVYPIEIEKNIPWKSYVTILFPGLGQLLNKQYIKSIIMFLGSIYIYAMAIPYALGYGNYKGDGIAGLISLAEGAGKLDRSVIFMIEGILAITLIVLALVLLLLSFKDVNKVEKEEIKGIRTRTWIETKQSLLEDGFPYLVSAPALVVTIFMVFIPVATTILLSFTGMDPKHQAKFGWSGISNYKMIALGQGVAGGPFWRILGWTIIWTLVATTLAIALGFILAIVLNNDRIKGKTLFRTIYLLPWAVPAFITITFFSILSSPNGALTQALQGIFGEGLSIKNNTFVARSVLICIQAWLGSAYVFLLSTGVLQSINKELYEAADIDGATSFKKLSKITIPLVLFQTAPLLVGQYTFNFNNFSIIWLFNNGGPFNASVYGNIAGSTDLLISYIYKLTLEKQYQALGAAITMIVSIALIIIAYIGYRNTEVFKKE